jgi:glycolate oxidase FAD binding subunit
MGAGTKARLAASNPGVESISLAGLTGIIEYDPSEFTFTAFAGTPVSQLQAALLERNQYLPFDPPFGKAGATLGGTVAAGLSGPGRLRFGGVRDFILGVRFVDGAGRLLRLGGKVVKNAAGFDLPKFFVGSLGRFGVLAELTFKVFPRPSSRLTLMLNADGIAQSAPILIEISAARWEVDALDILPGGKAIVLRLAGPERALPQIAEEILSRWPGEILLEPSAETLWSDLLEFRWAHAEGSLLKMALTPAHLVSLDRALLGLEDARLQVSAAGHVAFVSLAFAADVALLNERLKALGLSALVLKGQGPLWLGNRSRPAIGEAVKQALDPNNRFPSLDH